MRDPVVRNLWGLSRALMLSALVTAGTCRAVAQDAPTLPGGAGSLTETHGDWIVNCSIRDVGGKSAKLCAILQEQRESQSGKRVLRVELEPKGDHAEGTAILPFGLTLGAGVTLQIDEGKPGEALAFSTCLPGGCVLPMNIGSDMLSKMANAKQLKLNATALGMPEAQQAILLSVSLNGFSSALKRASELVQ